MKIVVGEVMESGIVCEADRGRLRLAREGFRRGVVQGEAAD